MYCPKCGSQQNEAVLFCSDCGAQLKPNEKTPVYQNTPNNEITTFFTKIGPQGIAARILGILAAIGMLMPWLSITALDSVNNFSRHVGMGSIPHDYSVLGLNELFTDYMVLGSPFDNFSNVFTVLWALALVLLVIGIITSFVGKRSLKLLMVGSIVVAVIALAWLLLCSAINGAIADEVGIKKVIESPFGPYLVVLGGIACFITSLRSVKKVKKPVQ